MPSCHAVGAIGEYCKENMFTEGVAKFVHPTLTKNVFLKTFQSMIHPKPEQPMWPKINTEEVLSPPLNKQPSKHKVSRKREDNEKPKGARSLTVKCKVCGQNGHNKRSCNGPISVKVTA